ncbi:Axoneme-associated protein [Citrus sinensis]|uniref:Axoneme-associated protein n=1 Tax=Citrus sinensis TaxID=2711 RepID=A0ACB8I8Z7_CITSI|nr:Axoneme-associated protein [Citrus sinensis]
MVDRTPTRADVAADDESFFGLGEMGEGESVGEEMRERDILVSKLQSNWASEAGKEKMHKNKQRRDMETKDEEMDFRKIMKDIEFLGSSHMSWKERKELENKRVVSLGGKASKKQRLPLSVARVPMKRQKEREQKMQEERGILGRFGAKFAGPKRATERRKPEDRVLKSSEGHFRNGVLDVKHLLRPGPSRDTESSKHMGGKGGNKGGKKGKQKNHGKKKGGKKKLH